MAFIRRRASPRQQSLSPSSSVSSLRENHRSGSTAGRSGGRGLQLFPCGCFRGVFLWGALLLVVFSVGLIGNVSYLWHSHHLQLTANTKQSTNHYSPISIQRTQQQQQRRVSERSIEDGDHDETNTDEDRTEEAVWKRMLQRSIHARDSPICASHNHPHGNESLSLSWSHNIDAPPHDAPKLMDKKGVMDHDADWKLKSSHVTPLTCPSLYGCNSMTMMILRGEP
eukprot:scaffold446117_cov63-Attheya_sp.AAC.2